MQLQFMRKFLVLAVAAVVYANGAHAGSIDVSIEIPSLSVAEYHRPYVAVWLEQESAKPTTLAVWYEVKKENKKGEEWLKDLRQWWRRGGREATMPIDGVSGATQLPGKHTLHFEQGKLPLGTLPDGKYTLKVEAAREVGGREILEVPFTWPVTAPLQQSVKGQTELGEVKLQITP